MRQREEYESFDETISGKIWKVALIRFDSDAEFVLCRCGSREAGAKRGCGSAGNHYRVGCGGGHFRKTWMAKAFREEQKGKYQREWKRSKEVDRNEVRKEEKNLRCAFLVVQLGVQKGST